MELLYIIFTYLTQKECFRVSSWSLLWCLGPRMNHLPPVWWSNFRSMFLNDSLCVSLIWWRGVFYCSFAFIIVFIHYQRFTYCFPLICFYSEIAFSYWVLCSYSTDVVCTFSCILWYLVCHRLLLWQRQFFLGPYFTVKHVPRTTWLYRRIAIEVFKDHRLMMCICNRVNIYSWQIWQWFRSYRNRHCLK